MEHVSSWHQLHPTAHAEASATTGNRHSRLQEGRTQNRNCTSSLDEKFSRALQALYEIVLHVKYLFSCQ